MSWPHWTNLEWSSDKPRGTAFYCDCCDATDYYSGTFMQGKDAFNSIRALLCFECYKYIGSNCDHCHPCEDT